MTCRPGRGKLLPLVLVALSALDVLLLKRSKRQSSSTETGWPAFGVMWPVAVLEAFKAWARYTSLGLRRPTAATPAGPPVARTHEEQ